MKFLLVFSLFGIVFLAGCTTQETQLTGKVTEPSQAPKEQATIESKCSFGYRNQYTCYENYRYQLYQYSNCSLGWVYLEYCSYGCSEAGCLEKLTTTIQPTIQEMTNKTSEKTYTQTTTQNTTGTNQPSIAKQPNTTQTVLPKISEPIKVEQPNTTQTVSPKINKPIKIANWNLQIFGVSKASNQTLMNFYADVIDDYDIIFIQEIRDSSQTALPKLCQLLEGYKCDASSRAGRTSSKEQYGIIYKDGIRITDLTDYNPDSQDRWERPPVKVTFDYNGYILTAYNIHIKPDDVKKELQGLESVVSNVSNVIVLGDLNADCTYYKPQQDTEFDAWIWIITDDQDTTVASTDCAYDRIIMNRDAYQEYASHGIYKGGITKDVSDHYLVWVEIKP